MSVQTTYVEARCLVCNLEQTVDFKYGGAKYIFCPICKKWSVLNHPETQRLMDEIEKKRYGFDRAAEALEQSDKLVVPEGSEPKEDADILGVFDQASGIDPDIWDAAEANLSTEGDRFLAIGSPRDPNEPQNAVPEGVAKP